MDSKVPEVCFCTWKYCLFMHTKTDGRIYWMALVEDILKWLPSSSTRFNALKHTLLTSFSFWRLMDTRPGSILLTHVLKSGALISERIVFRFDLQYTKTNHNFSKNKQELRYWRGQQLIQNECQFFDTVKCKSLVFRYLLFQQIINHR